MQKSESVAQSQKNDLAVTSCTVDINTYVFISWLFHQFSMTWDISCQLGF